MNTEGATREAWSGMGDHHVSADHLTNGYYVSTIRRGEHLRDVDGLIGLMVALVGGVDRADLTAPGDYETMVFRSPENGVVESWTELDFARYVTEDEAREGHERMVEKWLGE